MGDTKKQLVIPSHVELMRNYRDNYQHIAGCGWIGDVDQIELLAKTAQTARHFPSQADWVNVNLDGLTAYLGFNDGRKLVKLTTNYLTDIARFLKRTEYTLYLFDAESNMLVCAVKYINDDAKKTTKYSVPIYFKYPWPAKLNSDQKLIRHFNLSVELDDKCYYVASMRPQQQSQRWRLYDAVTHELLPPKDIYRGVAHNSVEVQLREVSHIYLMQNGKYRAVHKRYGVPIDHYITLREQANELSSFLVVSHQLSKHMRLERDLAHLVNVVKLPAKFIIEVLELMGHKQVRSFYDRMSRHYLPYREMVRHGRKHHLRRLVRLMYTGGMLQKVNDANYKAGHHQYQRLKKSLE